MERFDPPDARRESTTVGYGDGRLGLRVTSDGPTDHVEGVGEAGKLPSRCAPPSLAR